MTDPDFGLPPVLVPVALGIGALCYQWATLEQIICDSLVWMAKIRSKSFSRAIVRCTDFRDQLSALKLSAVANIDDDKCIDALISEIDYIDNTLRVRRNRYVHDSWFLGTVKSEPGIQVFRSSYAMTIKRPQARQRRELTWDMRHEKPGDLAILVEEVRAHADYIRLIILSLGKRRVGLKRLLSKPPQRRILRPQSETPNLWGSVPREPRRHRRSSPA